MSDGIVNADILKVLQLVKLVNEDFERDYRDIEARFRMAYHGTTFGESYAKRMMNEIRNLVSRAIKQFPQHDGSAEDHEGVAVFIFASIFSRKNEPPFTVPKR